MGCSRASPCVILLQDFRALTGGRMATKKAVKKAVKKGAKVSKISKTKKAATPAKKTAKKVTVKKKAAVKKGDRYACDVCGLVVAVDKACGCARSCDILCCDEPMTRTK
jgi:hypothetical protein